MQFYTQILNSYMYTFWKHFQKHQELPGHLIGHKREY